MNFFWGHFRQALLWCLALRSPWQRLPVLSPARTEQLLDLAAEPPKMIIVGVDLATGPDVSVFAQSRTGPDGPYFAIWAVSGGKLQQFPQKTPGIHS